MSLRRQSPDTIAVAVASVILAGGLLVFSRAQSAEPEKAKPAPSQPAETKPAPTKPAETKPPAPENIRQGNPTFLVRADVNRATRSYREDDYLSVQVASEADAYVYVLYKQADGKVFQIFPNSVQTNNRVKARQIIQIPATEDRFRWEIGPPFGKEVVKVVASKEPLEALSGPTLRAKFFNPVTPQQVKGLRLELGKEKPPVWAEDTVEITTYARDEKLESLGARRWGVFIGVGDYQFISKVQGDASGKKEKVVLPCHRDARTLAAMLREVGQLSDMRICTNEQATRKDIEEAITQWLPSLSRPGDTTFIFFSGLGLPLPTGEKDDAVLAAYDFLTPPILAELQKANQEGNLPLGLKSQLAEAMRLVQQAGGSEPQAAFALAQATGVSNAQFAHWLQRLAGRQVVIILDAGFAASFAPPGVEGQASGKNLELAPFLNGVNRLNDLGQQEIALLGSCRVGADVPRVPDELSLLTSCLVKTIGGASGSVTLEQAHQVACAVLRDIVARINQQQKTNVPPLKPYFVNSCTRPVVLKP
jgi:hypothetical protein